MDSRETERGHHKTARQRDAGTEKERGKEEKREGKERELEGRGKGGKEGEKRGSKSSL